MDSHRRVVELVPGSAEALSNLGVAYGACGRWDAAVDCLAHALALRPDGEEIRYSLGNALLGAGRFGDAIDAYDAVLHARPDHVRARTNLGAADAVLTEAVAHAQEDADVAWNLGLTRLMAGAYETGWAFYERRRAIPGFAIRRPTGPAWDGGPLGPDETPLIHAEQGLGDTLQFVRSAPSAAAVAGGPTIFQGQTPLAPLPSAALPPGIQVTGADRSPRHAAQAPLLSMPYLLDRTDPLVPPHGRYLRADPARVAAWRDRLPDAGPRVGLAWQGNPDYRLDRRRSCPLRCFAPLAEQPDIRLVSLQKGLGVDQAEAVPWREALMEPERGLDADGAFLDTAAVMTVLDLVITSDIAIAHLAGGLGVPVWLPLADAPDWRWGLSGDTSSWYPSMRLFRQSAPGDWDGVVRRVASEIVRGGLAPAVG